MSHRLHSREGKRSATAASSCSSTGRRARPRVRHAARMHGQTERRAPRLPRRLAPGFDKDAATAHELDHDRRSRAVTALHSGLDRLHPARL